MENLTYLFAAYGIIWILVFGYLFLLSRRQRALQQEVTTLEEQWRRMKGNRP